MLQQNKTTKPSGKEHRQKHSVLLFLAIFAFVGVIVAGSIINYAQAAQNDKKTEEVYAQYVEQSETNDEMKQFLQEKNHNAYFEKIAREDFGYGKPGERVVYDSSFGN